MNHLFDGKVKYNLNTLQLEYYMLTDPYISKYYGGVLAIDELPLIVKKPTVIIVNSDPIRLAGTHWYALLLDNVNEHFDSAGLVPEESLNDYLSLQGTKYLYNSKRVQAFDTDTCGLYCLFYCYFRCRGHSFREIMNMFSDNLKLNEFVVKLFYSVTT